MIKDVSIVTWDARFEVKKNLSTKEKTVSDGVIQQTGGSVYVSVVGGMHNHTASNILR